MIAATMAVASATASGVDLVGREARLPRLVALILDTFFIGVISLIAANVYGVTIVTSGSPIPNNGLATWTSDTAIPGIWAIAIWLVYYIVCEAMFAATPGKALSGLVAVSADGQRLTLARVAIRNLMRLIDVLPGAYLLGGVFVLTTLRSQRLGDMAAQTTVVLRRRVIHPNEISRSSSHRARLVLAAALAAVAVFTAFFDYFGRPPLVIESAYNQRQLLGPDLVSYELGTPSRTLTTVTYPLTGRTATQACTGEVTLEWAGLYGWQLRGGTLDCPPG